MCDAFRERDVRGVRKTCGNGDLAELEDAVRTPCLGILRADVHIVHQWDGLVEARVLWSPDSGTADFGALAALYRQLGDASMPEPWRLLWDHPLHRRELGAAFTNAIRASALGGVQNLVKTTAENPDVFENIPGALESGLAFGAATGGVEGGAEFVAKPAAKESTSGPQCTPAQVRLARWCRAGH